jgi:hypothetical protein
MPADGKLNLTRRLRGLIILSHNPTGIRPHQTSHHILIKAHGGTVG